MKYLKSFCLILILTLAFNANANSLINIKQSIDIANAWSGHPARSALITLGQKQFVAFYDPARQLTIATRNLNSTNWHFEKIDEFVELDAHNYIALAADNDGYLHMAANMHVHPLKYWRTKKPYDISGFEKLDFMTGKNEKRCTYPIFFRDKDGALLFKYRFGQSGSGNEAVNIYNEKTKSWKRKLSNPLLDGQGIMNAYQSGPVKGPDGLFHLGWVWRDASGCQFNHDVGYAQSKDLIHWQDSNGKVINLPITIETGELVDPVRVCAGLLNSLHIGFDSKKRCVMTYFKFDQDGDTQVFAARLEKQGWKIYQITDWTNRWDFNGGGSIPNMIINGSVKYNKTIGLYYDFQNKYIFGNLKRYACILDENTLKPASKPFPIYPGLLSKVKSPVKEMQVNLSGGVPFMLRWESLGGQRDVVKDLDWVPTNQMLQLLELEWTDSVETQPYVQNKDIDLSYRAFFSNINFDKNKNLNFIKNAVNKKKYLTAVKLLRNYLSKKDSSEIKNIANKKNILKSADEFYQHKFDFNNIKRTLLFDIQTWYPIKNDVMENWDVTWALALKCRPIKFEELKKISPIADWYNHLNCLPHLSAFGKAYAISGNPKYARIYIHDLQDWMYDNPAPSLPTALPGPWYISLVTERLKTSLTEHVNLFAGSKDISDAEFFYLINTIQKHKIYLKSCLKSDEFNEHEKNAADKVLKKCAKNLLAF